MSNARTGLWAAIGALAGGVAGAQAGKYAAQIRPRRTTYGRPGGNEIEDAMVVGAAAGAVIGSFVAGTVAGETAAPALPK